MSKSTEEIRKVQRLIRLERDEEQHYYQNKIIRSSLSDRRREGLTWYPVDLNKQYLGTGERLFVELVRTRDIGQPHVFQPGKVVSLFVNSGAGDGRKQSLSGVVSAIRNEKMTLVLNTDDLPDWIDDGKLGVDMLFDEASFREMDRALSDLMKLEKGRSFQLREILYGHLQPSFTSRGDFSSDSLNESQNKALQKVMDAEDLAIIHGPPGTGKTTTIVQAIYHTVKVEKQVLVSAPSNAAVDLLAEKLASIGLNVLRIGHPARVTAPVISNTLDARIASHDSFKDLKTVRKRADEMRNMAYKYKRKYGKAEKEQRKLLIRESHRMRGEADMLEHYIVNDLMEQVQVVLCTLVGASHELLRGRTFGTVFIDEAAQAIEPACWIPILKAHRVIFAGDHCQLPPTVRSIEAARDGLSETLFEKAISRQEADVMLTIQYRMHRDIMNFSSSWFYENRLRAHPSVAQSLLPGYDRALLYIDTAGCGYTEQVDKETLSTYNTEEADLLLRHLKESLQALGGEQVVEQGLTIAVIAPYKAQVNLLRDKAAADEEFRQYTPILSIDTVDAFQGQERDIIYISLVRSNEKGIIGFLSDIRRMNVALTRAKQRLVVLGDSATLGTHDFYSRFVDYAQEVNGYQSAFEILYS
ncbi:AAA domain-containing protein [Roseivirga sp. BDSF3-8]|uniref:AAA domain-containing protein n=1 Tax=Roseivirga sp. BDSF3-8 TaxID=3241598 RepID=UPI0035319215